MKRIFLAAAIATVALLSSAQPKVQVQSMERVQLPYGMYASVPTISPKGDFVVMNSNDALQRVDLATGKVRAIAPSTGAYQITISPDGSQVGYLEPTYIDQMRYVTLKSADLATGKVIEHTKPSRHLSSGMSFSGNTLAAVESGKQKVAVLKGRAAAAPVAAINYGHLDITINGKTTSIDPQGPGSYLWPSISPDGKKVVYWCVGKGCFVCNLDGSNLRSLGELRMAVWAGNNMVVGILDRDNGEVITSSVILASDLKGEKVQLTPDGIIALAPSASTDGKRVAFVSDDGVLYIMNLNF